MRVLVIGGYDFSAMEFEHKYKGTKVIDIINDIDSFSSTDKDEAEWDLTVKEIDGEISQGFIDFTKSQIDYEHSKDTMWYTENETI